MCIIVAEEADIAAFANLDADAIMGSAAATPSPAPPATPAAAPPSTPAGPESGKEYPKHYTGRANQFRPWKTMGNSIEATCKTCTSLKSICFR